MILAWIGLACLSVSWLPGLGYYHEADWVAWVFCVVAGTLAMLGSPVRPPAARVAAWTCPLVLPACWFAPWPYRAPMILITVGLFLSGNLLALGVLESAAKGESIAVMRRVERFLACYRRLASGTLAAGLILLAQALGLELYMACTSRSHELPGPLAQVLGVAARVLGIDAAVFGSTLSAFSMRTIHHLGATWELLLDPASWCFLTGGALLVLWHVADTWPGASSKAGWAAGLRRGALGLVGLVAPVLVWLPFRAALLIAMYLHDVLRVEYDAPLQVMKRFWSTPTHALLLLGPVVLAWRFVPVWTAAPRPKPSGNARMAQVSLRRRLLAALAAAVGVGAITSGILWDPPGPRKAGRVVFEEYHPEGDKQWERTDKPFDTTWYGHLSGYNYWCIYDYLTRFYDVTRRTQPLNDVALDDCDVLIVKVPTRPYSHQEIEAIEKFVLRGGGLLLVGEHTNVFGSSTYLNSIARRFGFAFRPDCLFGVDRVFEQRYEPPRVPHPMVQFIANIKSSPWMRFATSCSIDPGTSRGRAVIRSVGLKSLGADYHVSNFYPKPDDRPEMRYGAWIQLWAMRYGRGRVVAFTDSTIFSNFCVFEPGKKELWMGMVEWLNRQNPPWNPRAPLVFLGAAALGVAWGATRGWRGAWPILVGAGILGWTGAAAGVGLSHQAGMPYPEPLRGFAQVSFDQTICSPRLPDNGFISIHDTDYGIFERWVLRLGYFTARRSDPELLDEWPSLVVFLEPSKPVSPEFRKRLERYLEEGGKILVVDSPAKPTPRRRTRPAPQLAPPDSDLPNQSAPPIRAERPKTRVPTTNELLELFGLKVDHATVVGGRGAKLTSSEGWPAVPITGAVVVQGGRPFAWVDGKPVGASISIGNQGGSVTVIGFGPRFADDQMGASGDVEPDKSNDPHLANVYAWEYGLVRAIAEGRPLGLGTQEPAGQTPASKP